MSSVVILGVLRPADGCPAAPPGTLSLVIPNGLGPLEDIEPSIMKATFAGMRASIINPSVSGVIDKPIPVFGAAEACSLLASESRSFFDRVDERYACNSE